MGDLVVGVALNSEFFGGCGYACSSAKSTIQLGKTIWKRPSLKKHYFGNIRVWKSTILEIIEFGRMQLRKLSNLEMIKIGNADGPSRPPYNTMAIAKLYLLNIQLAYCTVMPIASNNSMF